VRARVVCGDEDLARSFAAIRLDVINAARDPATLLSDVRAMRARMLARPSAGDTRRFDIKRDAGGIADIEFIVQYYALRWPLVLRDYLPHTDNERLLQGIAATGLMAQSDASLLADAYRQYRERVHALALEERDAVCPVDELSELREAVSDLWSRFMEAGC